MCARVACALALCGLAACASGPSAQPATARAGGVELTRLSDVAEAQERRIAELEARIGLLEQEARVSSQHAARGSSKPTETVRIGADVRRDESAARAESRDPVTVVRLHEDEPQERAAKRIEAAPQTPWVLPTPPRGVSTSLDVVPLPGERAKLELQGASADPRTRYRDALALIKARRYDDAVAQLAALARELPPEHALAAQATYWKGEAHYAARRYRDALVAFEALIARFPSSSKVPDALLKAGLCNQHLGQDAVAQRYFDQVRKEHPTSDAAQSAPREGSS